jgi:hypothetical protein
MMDGGSRIHTSTVKEGKEKMEPLTRPGFGIHLNPNPSSRSKFSTIQDRSGRSRFLTMKLFANRELRLTTSKGKVEA